SIRPSSLSPPRPPLLTPPPPPQPLTSISPPFVACPESLSSSFSPSTKRPIEPFLLGTQRQAIGSVHLTVNLSTALSHSNTFRSGWLKLAGPSTTKPSIQLHRIVRSELDP
ncbi:hypothetical protein VIGAN_03145700, partial [Vigna angularis var. angularis]